MFGQYTLTFAEWQPKNDDFVGVVGGFMVVLWGFYGGEMGVLWGLFAIAGGKFETW